MQCGERCCKLSRAGITSQLSSPLDHTFPLHFHTFPNFCSEPSEFLHACFLFRGCMGHIVSLYLFHVFVGFYLMLRISSVLLNSVLTGLFFPYKLLFWNFSVFCSHLTRATRKCTLKVLCPKQDRLLFPRNSHTKCLSQFSLLEPYYFSFISRWFSPLSFWRSGHCWRCTRTSCRTLISSSASRTAAAPRRG